MDRSDGDHSHLEGVLVLIDELTLTHYLPIGILGTRMATSELLKVSWHQKAKLMLTLHTRHENTF